MIYADHLTKYYGHQPAIQNINFHVNKGEILGLVGPAGAGKTTLMRILTAYTPPSTGTAIVGGYDVLHESMAVRRQIGYLPELVCLYNDMTVGNYMEFVAALRQVNHRVRRIKDALEQVDLSRQVNTRIGKLTKDQRQRVGLAQAIVHHPTVLLLDEPTTGLEPPQIIVVRQLIKSLGQEYTIILNTSILSEAQQLCNRVLVINKGQLIEDPLVNLEDVLLGLAPCPKVKQ